ncbi:mRNA N(3)-methylcytidine methyltransferase METTL8 [Protopterus annectens]|uniref:mRNA N(3)-methylcytidine methyltransferase METTL8 n=1 Tax=Protopterus annectens TaxID=7888 RepID=UPI001CFC44FF|nr:mRNA N(3)-methylcytidine methyltransferase METTL8 [Protopterus annectens]XP_043931457.1 mRNA N(3)-methylcytidine methyltransferase METTL8 [Protopterus annectens]XP_043931458.1 mRNA N(3)-methylcytidine methyltransferase METTL8 [Protopterus annectens]XP_043931459.1 mRNA N(3)-methylcytidine methyltransferase METTL8 [Protopterus annectens]
MKIKIQICLIQKLSIIWLKSCHSHCRFKSRGRPTAPLGSRILTDPARVFEHNMWDHMQWTEAEVAAAKKKALENSSPRVPHQEQVKYEKEASKYWDQFYRTHKNKFFKDRNWLFTEFPEILPYRKVTQLDEENKSNEIRNVCTLSSESKTLYSQKSVQGTCGHFETPIVTSSDSTRKHKSNKTSNGTHCMTQNTFPIVIGNGQDPVESEMTDDRNASFRIFEVGCGAGNTLFPILNAIGNESGIFLYCSDFSKEAVDLVKLHSCYNPACCYTFVHDVCDETQPFPFPDGSIDVILLVFMLSSVLPERMPYVITRLAHALKPGGKILFRDYGRHDLSQLRFKKGHCLFDNFYVRGDGTRVYFFTKDEIHNIFTSAGLNEIQNVRDKRLQVNRRKKLQCRESGSKQSIKNQNNIHKTESSITA